MTAQQGRLRDGRAIQKDPTAGSDGRPAKGAAASAAVERAARGEEGATRRAPGFSLPRDKVGATLPSASDSDSDSSSSRSTSSSTSSSRSSSSSSHSHSSNEASSVANSKQLNRLASRARQQQQSLESGAAGDGHTHNKKAITNANDGKSATQVGGGGVGAGVGKAAAAASATAAAAAATRNSSGGRTSSTSAAAGATAQSVPQGSKRWHAPGAGAPVAGGSGRFVHTWDEHRRPHKRRRSDAASDSGEESGGSDGGCVQWKTGPWAAEEDELLQQAFDEYCTEHGLSGAARDELITEGVKNTAHKTVWLAVAGHFQHRTVRSIHRRAQILLHPDRRKGKFGAEELTTLLALVKQHGRAWKTIGALMSRPPQIVRGAYDAAQHRSTGGLLGEWSASEEASLQALVRKYNIGSTAASDAAVTWGVVASKLPGRSAQQCIDKWRELSVRHSRSGSGWSSERDAALVRAVLADGGESHDEVEWAALLPGLTAAAARERFDVLMKRLPRDGATAFYDRVKALANELGGTTASVSFAPAGPAGGAGATTTSTGAAPRSANSSSVSTNSTDGDSSS